MSGTYALSMGDRGRVVIPSEVRAHVGIEPGTPLVLIEAPGGLMLLTREQLKQRVREDLAGLDLLEELLDERRRAAADEDTAA